MILTKQSHLFSISIVFVSYSFWKVFTFTHPYPSFYLNFIFFIQFFIVLLGFLFSLKLGRIFLVTIALCGTRVWNLFFDESVQIITNAPSFIGGIVGIYLKYLIENYKFSKNKNFYNSTYQLNLVYLSLVFFLFILGLERFLVYYNFPFLKELSLQELLYTPNLYSKQAFAYSIDLLSGLVFPILFFIIDEMYFPKKQRQHYLYGLIFTFCIQTIVILIQTFWDLNFLAKYTNNAPNLGRVTGLFRDAGSSSFIFPILILMIFYNFFYFKKKYYMVYLFLFISIILGLKQGRLYWFLIILGFIWIIIQHKDKIIKINKYFLIYLSLSLIVIGVYFIIKKTYNVDEHRFFLNKLAFLDFLTQPLFGKGVTHIPVSLDQGIIPIPTSYQTVDNPSLFLGIFSDTGILGGIVISLLIYYYFRLYNCLFSIFLLFFSSFVGYHVVHPDSAFWILLILSHINKKNKFPYNQFNWIGYSIFKISLSFIIPIFLAYKNEKPSPEFRYEVTGIYQDQVFERNIIADEQVKKIGIDSYHNFLGSVRWKLKEDLEFISPRFFLSKATKKESLNLRLSFLDKQKKLLEQKIITISKENLFNQKVFLPKDSYYLQVDEFSQTNKIEIFGKHIYSLDTKSFNSLREFN